jgi:hypothetical protein
MAAGRRLYMRDILCSEEPDSEPGLLNKSNIYSHIAGLAEDISIDHQPPGLTSKSKFQNCVTTR